MTIAEQKKPRGARATRLEIVAEAMRAELQQIEERLETDARSIPIYTAAQGRRVRWLLAFDLDGGNLDHLRAMAAASAASLALYAHEFGCSVCGRSWKRCGEGGHLLESHMGAEKRAERLLRKA